jgi:GMP synthase-like glutamine amidotransferase
LKVGLLECDDVVGRFPGIDGGYREMFAMLLPEFDFSFFAIHRDTFPENTAECDAWIATGSKHAVYEGHPWVARASEFLRELQKAKRPFVGICFGHQLLAHALGGEVAKARQGWGAGVLPVELLRHEPWMQPPKPAVRIQHMHQDQIQRLPEGSVLLGRSPHCEIGMFRVGESMLGIEGHPEFTVAYARALIEARRGSIGEQRAREALADVAEPNDGRLVGQWIGEFLIRAASGRRPATSSPTARPGTPP